MAESMERSAVLIRIRHRLDGLVRVAILAVLGGFVFARGFFGLMGERSVTLRRGFLRERSRS